MPDIKRTRKGRPGPGAQRSVLIRSKGKATGRDAQVAPKRSAGQQGPVTHAPRSKKPIETELEGGDSVEAFLERATLRETEYQAFEEESAPVLVTSGGGGGGDEELEEEEEEEMAALYAALPVPRRPAWDERTTADELRALEESSFLDWRRGVATAEEAERRRRETYLARRASFLAPSATVATPFERNLEVWRQLWRTLERSDCVFLVVDARWPCFYANDDLAAYVAESGKQLIVLNNKSDYLTSEQRRAWHQYWTQTRGLQCCFFSARLEQRRLDAEAKQRAARADADAFRGAPETSDTKAKDDAVQSEQKHEAANQDTSHEDEPSDDDDVGDAEDREEDATEEADRLSRLLKPEEVLALGEAVARRRRDRHAGPAGPDERPLCIGMVGYPNVGKSSCVNALRGASAHGVGARAGVSATPGKTKHLQTLRVGTGLELCDCPGLVFPALVRHGAAELVCSGVVPLPKARDPLAAADLVLRRVPAAVLDVVYGTKVSALALTGGARDSDQVLDAFCRARDFTTAGSGQPDRRRAARRLVADYVDGVLLHCHPPPDLPDERRPDYDAHTRRTALANSDKLRAKLAATSDPVLAAAARAAGFDVGPTTPADLDLASDAAKIKAAQLLTDNGVSNNPNQTRAGGPIKAHHKRWGKKGRKFRPADPYASKDDLDVPAVS